MSLRVTPKPRGGIGAQRIGEMRVGRQQHLDSINPTVDRATAGAHAKKNHFSNLLGAYGAVFSKIRCDFYLQQIPPPIIEIRIPMKNRRRLYAPAAKKADVRKSL